MKKLSDATIWANETIARIHDYHSYMYKHYECCKFIDLLDNSTMDISKARSPLQALDDFHKAHTTASIVEWDKKFTRFEDGNYIEEIVIIYALTPCKMDFTNYQ